MTIADTLSSTFSDTRRLKATSRFGIDSSLHLIAILATYLLIILKIAPSYMKNRPAYQLKTFMIVYNVLQVIACFYLIYKIYVIDLPTLQFWECVDFQRGSIVEKDFNHISIFTFWLKVVELSETVVFVLRKKERQVSFLHVFHHCATLFLVCQLFATYKSSPVLYPLFLNCTVHVFMYIYYLLSACLPANMVAKLTPMKKAITTIQMIQFAMILLQVIVGLSVGCRAPSRVLYSYIVIICAFFYMFYDFYQKSYNEKQPTDDDENIHHHTKLPQWKFVL